VFGTVVLGTPKREFDQALHTAILAVDAPPDADLSERTLCLAIEAFKKVIATHSGVPFPQDPQKQLFSAIKAVFNSWQSERAQCYRKLNGIADDIGTAVTVQAMVFGNRGMDSGTGVGFTRNPSTGAKHIFGEYLQNAQGEDIVAGVRTPVDIGELSKMMPEVYAELLDLTSRLEQHHRDVQDFEFTIDSGKLFLLHDTQREASAACGCPGCRGHGTGGTDFKSRGRSARETGKHWRNPISTARSIRAGGRIASAGPARLTGCGSRTDCSFRP